VTKKFLLDNFFVKYCTYSIERTFELTKQNVVNVNSENLIYVRKIDGNLNY